MTIALPSTSWNRQRDTMGCAFDIFISAINRTICFSRSPGRLKPVLHQHVRKLAGSVRQESKLPVFLMRKRKWSERSFSSISNFCEENYQSVKLISSRHREDFSNLKLLKKSFRLLLKTCRVSA